MSFYICLFFLVFIFSFCYTYSVDKNAAVCLKSIVFLLLFIPSALRYGIGTDYENYVNIFYDILNNVDVRTEAGWVLLNKFCISFNLDVQWVFILSTFFTIYYMFKTPKKDFFIVIVLFFCLFYLDSYNMTRQGLTMAICWYAYLCFINGKKKKCYLYVIISSLFHTSGLIILLCFFIIDKFKILNKKIVNVLLICCFLLSYTNILMNIFGFILSFTKYGIYIEMLDYYNTRSAGYGNIYTLLFRTFFLLLIFNSYSFTRNNVENKCIVYFLLLLELSDVISLNMFMANRVKMMFYLFYIMIMIPLYQQKGNVILKIKKIGFITFFILYYLVLKLLTGANAIIPYQMIKF